MPYLGYIRTEKLSSTQNGTLVIPLCIVRLILKRFYFPIDQQNIQYKNLSTLNNNMFPLNNNKNNHYISYWDKSDKNYIKPKYKSLCQELQKNKIYSLSRTTLKEIYAKSKRLLSLDSFRRKYIAKNRGKWNKICNIKKGSIIKLDHIISLKILILSFNGLIPITTTIHEKQAIAHFCRLIYESIKFFGKYLSQTIQSNKLYIGINKKNDINSSLFNGFTLSTTSSLHIANTFAADKGLIIEIKSLDKKGPLILDCGMISEYVEEQQYQIINDYIDINNIYLYKNNGAAREIEKSYIGIKLWKKIFNGSILVDNNGKLIDFNVQNQRTMMKLFTEYAKIKTGNELNLDNYHTEQQHCNDVHINISDAVQKLFNQFMDNMTHLMINEHYINQINLIPEMEFIRNLFQTESCKSVKQIFMELNFKNKIYSVPFMKWDINGIQIDKLWDLHIIKGDKIKCSIQHLICIPHNDNNYSRYIEFRPYCTVNQHSNTFEFGIELINKPSYIDNIEYEYEFYIPSMLFYYMCSSDDANFPQQNLIDANSFKNHNTKQFTIEIVIRIVNCVINTDQQYNV